MKLIALHGFLGRIQDWDPWSAEDFGASEFHPLPIFPDSTLQIWAKEFNAWARKNREGPQALIGYSLGGRLALHALLDEPSLWEKGFLISTHPGLTCIDEKRERLKADEEWADRFVKEPWKELMEAWEAQNIFQGNGYRFNRIESHYDRLSLSRMLAQFSLGLQTNLLEPLAALPIPLCWITGERDKKYSILAKNALQVHSLSTHEIISNAAHRAPWDDFRGFSRLIKHHLLKKC